MACFAVAVVPDSVAAVVVCQTSESGRPRVLVRNLKNKFVFLRP